MLSTLYITREPISKVLAPYILNYMKTIQLNKIEIESLNRTIKNQFINNLSNKKRDIHRKLQSFYDENKIVPTEEQIIDICMEIVSRYDADNRVLEELLDKLDRKSTRLNSSHSQQSRMPSSA